MLTDHKRDVERWAARRRERAALPKAFGDFIAGLAPWDWWVGISFREDVKYPDAGVKAVKGWLTDIERNAGPSVGYVLAEEFGDWGGRFHCHALLSGVNHLRRRFWWSEAFRRFGRTTIEPFDPVRAAAYYTAKYAAKQLGNLHFGGVLGGNNIDLPGGSKKEPPAFRLAESKQAETANKEIARSNDLTKIFFRLGLKRWHR